MWHAINLKVKSGEIVGIAGVSGNGQSALVEVLSGQRQMTQGQIFVNGQDFTPTRGNFAKFKVFGLQEEPLKNAAVPRMSVAENIAFRTYDKPPIASFGWWMKPGPLKRKAEELIARYNVKTTSPDSPIEALSGGNVQRAILARELSGDVDVLIVANPCFGLDFASVADIRSQIMKDLEIHLDDLSAERSQRFQIAGISDFRRLITEEQALTSERHADA